MKNFALLGVISIVMLSPDLLAEDARCSLVDAARSGEAALRLDCGTGSGFVDNDTSLKILRLKIFSVDGVTRDLDIQNPPGGIIDYYGVNSSQYLRNQYDIGEGDRIELAEIPYVIDSATPLYSDPDETAIVGSAGTAEVSPATPAAPSTSPSTTPTTSPAPTNVSPNSVVSCTYSEEPLIISFAGGCQSEICNASVQCTLGDGRIISNEASCYVNSNGACPDATTCGLSPDITYALPAYISPTSGQSDSRETGAIQ